VSGAKIVIARHRLEQKRLYLMTTISNDLARILSAIRCHGDFYAAGTSKIASKQVLKLN
jgi:hypothetical protein